MIKFITLFSVLSALELKLEVFVMIILL